MTTRRKPPAEDAIPRQTVEELAAALRALLDAVERGDLTAGGGMVSRLEGAVVVLEQLLGGAEGVERRRPE